MRRQPSIWSDHLPDGMVYTEFPENSMYAFLEERTAHDLHRTAIEFEGNKISYRMFLKHIDEIASSLLFHTIKKGDIVTVISPNIPQALETIYAVNKIGAVANILHPLLPAAETIYHIEKTESKAVFILDSLFTKIENTGWKIDPPWIILFSIPDSLAFPKNVFLRCTKLFSGRNRSGRPSPGKLFSGRDRSGRPSPGKLFSGRDRSGRPSPGKSFSGTDRVLGWKNFLKRHAAEPVSCRGEAEDVALILYTGGTTGIQKGVCLTNRNINCHGIHCCEVFSGMRNMRTLALMPIFHGFGLCSNIHTMLISGDHLFLLPSYNTVKCSKLIFRKRIQVISAIPAFYEALVRSDEMRTKDCSFFRILVSGGDRLNQQTERAVNSYLEKSGLTFRITQGYGQTECVAACMCNALFHTKEGSAGMAFPDTDLKIVSIENGEDLPAGAVGELCVSGPSVMKGYYKDEEATAQVLKVHADGRSWLHTGDTFSFDEDGFYTFHGRLRRMFIVNGFNVYPEWVENTIREIPGIAQCCVVGTSARIGGDRIAAAVCLDEDCQDLTPQKILRKCRPLLPEYAVPYKIVILDQIPLTGIGKIDYQRIAGEIGERES